MLLFVSDFADFCFCSGFQAIAGARRRDDLSYLAACVGLDQHPGPYTLAPVDEHQLEVGGVPLDLPTAEFFGRHCANLKKRCDPTEHVGVRVVPLANFAHAGGAARNRAAVR